MTYLEQMSFCFFSLSFIILSIIKTVDKFRNSYNEGNNNTLRNQAAVDDALDEQSNVGDTVKKKVVKLVDTEKIDMKSFKSQKEQDKVERVNDITKLVKIIINYCSSFNSSFVIVGSLTESYYYGVRMVGNIMAVSIGYIYAFLLVIPFMTSLEHDIKTPYQFFERRYGSRKYVRVITATAAMIFYFSFLTLYIWGCTNLITTIVPGLPLWACSIIVGTYSIIGSTMGGFTQSTKLNLLQFLLVLTGLILAAAFTIDKHTQTMTWEKLYDIASSYERTTYFDTHVDLETRYTILNQILSLSFVWCSFHGLLLPNFIRYRAIDGGQGSKLKKGLVVLSNWPFMIIVNLILLLSGGIMIFLYFLGCDPTREELLKNKNQTGPYWLHMVFAEYAPTFTGILFSSIVCYSIIQHSMGMSLCADTVYCEIIHPIMQMTKQKLKDKWVKIVKLGLTLYLGAVSIIYAISFAYVGNSMLSLFFIFNNSTNAPILGLYFLSVFNPYANHVGAMATFVLNLSINYWLALGHMNIYSSTVNQQFPQTLLTCDSEYSYQNITAVNSILQSYANPFNVTDDKLPYYPENDFVFTVYTMAPIWWCIWSSLFHMIVGSLLSLAYSLYKTKGKGIDADADFAEKRQEYLFIPKMRNSYYK